jgi:hypothetical protein
MLITVNLHAANGQQRELHRGEDPHAAMRIVEHAAVPDVEVPSEYVARELLQTGRSSYMVGARGGGLVIAESHRRWPGEVM